MNPNRNLRRHDGVITRADRERLLGQRGAVLWLTGLPGSGKSTLARALEERLARRGRLVYVLDGDNLRHGLCADLGFDPPDRAENVRRTGHVAALLADAGVLVVAALISPFRADRDAVRALLGDDFVEVFVDTPAAVCEARDPKGLWAKARAGALPAFTGVDSPYEPPARPELHLHAERQTPAEAAAAIVALLAQRGHLSPPAGPA